MKQKIIALILLSPLLAMSQNGESVGSSGNVMQNGGVSIRWNMGGLVNGLMTSEGLQLSNGYYVQQDMEALSIEDNSMTAKSIMYPNPATSWVSFTLSGDAIFSIYDINGREVASGKTSASDNRVDVSKLSAGTYVVSVSQNYKTNTYKLLKQ